MEINDDYGNATRPYRVVACLAVQGRIPLLKHTIERLYKKNGCYKVICAGDGMEEKRLCESLGAVWAPHGNKPLGAKWNRAFMAAKPFKPDAVLFVGSSDWISSDWIPTLRPYVEEYHFVGVPGCHFLDIAESMRLVDWKGYGEERKESIGIGRMISAKVMDSLEWRPFEEASDHSMDSSMKKRVEKAGGIEFMYNGAITALSISTNKWPNKHNFEEHWTNKLPSEKIADVDGFLKDFPEAYQIFK